MARAEETSQSATTQAEKEGRAEEEDVPVKFSSSSGEGGKLEAKKSSASERGFMQPWEWGSFMDPFELMPRLARMHQLDTLNRMFHLSPFERTSSALDTNLFRTMDRMMDQQMASLMDVPFRMHLDVGSDKDTYVIDAMVPGLKKEDVEVTLANDRLRVSAKHDEEKATDEGLNWSRRSIHRSWSEEIALPENADLSSEAIHAKLEDGILRIRINKIKKDAEEEEEEAKSVRVPIE